MKLIKKEQTKHITHINRFNAESTCGIFVDVYMHVNHFIGYFKLERLIIMMPKLHPNYTCNDIKDSYMETIKVVSEYLKSYSIIMPDTTIHLNDIDDRCEYKFCSFGMSFHIDGDTVYTYYV